MDLFFDILPNELLAMILSYTNIEKIAMIPYFEEKLTTNKTLWRYLFNFKFPDITIEYIEPIDYNQPDLMYFLIIYERLKFAYKQIKTILKQNIEAIQGQLKAMKPDEDVNMMYGDHMLSVTIEFYRIQNFKLLYSLMKHDQTLVDEYIKMINPVKIGKLRFELEDSMTLSIIYDSYNVVFYFNGQWFEKERKLTYSEMLTLLVRDKYYRKTDIFNPYQSFLFHS